MILRTQDEVTELKRDISSLEQDLASSGSTKTTDEVQADLDSISAEL